MITWSVFAAKIEQTVEPYRYSAMTPQVLLEIRQRILSELLTTHIVFQDKEVVDVLVTCDDSSGQLKINYLTNKYDPDKPIQVYRERLHAYPMPIEFTRFALPIRINGKPGRIDKATAYIKRWRETMTADEVQFCEAEIRKRVVKSRMDNVGDFRAARLWKSSQRRRFFREKQEEAGMCGQYDFIARCWNEHKGSFDLYLLGFNYGH